MTKKKFLWGMLVFVFGLVLAGCPTDNDGDGGNNGTPATSGKLTITGLGSYNGKFAVAMGSTEDDETSVACAKATSETTMESVLISNGQVVLSVYQFTGGKYVSYSGNDTVSLYIAILSSKDDPFGEKEGPPENMVAYSQNNSVTFASGVGTVSNPTITVMQ